jgi:hypothetical protein
VNRRILRFELELDLDPQQAHFLWDFLETLAGQVWDAYEGEILDQGLEHPRSTAPEKRPLTLVLPKHPGDLSEP